ncbi:MAG: sec-C metal-binding protein [Planctomycetota bacterium]|nr:sec-C metal-binding protein [Planctomycetota bacterium]
MRRRGGNSLLGWTIWEWPGVLLEAISHGVWERSDGELLDPTPKADGEETTLFLPDRNAVDTGGVVLARRWPLADWPEIAEYTDVCRRVGEAQQQYYPTHGGVPGQVCGPLLRWREDLEAAIIQRQVRESARRGLTKGVALTEAEAASRSSASPDDVEASTALARHLAARGDFGSAFSALIRTVELGGVRASQVREAFLELFEACDDQSMVNEYRRQFAMLLY